MEDEKLYIPTKILDSDDFVTGFGAKEIYVSMIAAVFSAVFGVVMNQITGNTFTSVLLAVSVIVVTIFLVRRDMCNENIFQKIKILCKDSRVQKQYKYQYTNIYEDILYEETEK